MIMIAERIIVGTGYKGLKNGGPREVILASWIQKNATRTFQKPLRRKSLIEPTIGYMKSDQRLEQNFLKGKEGDWTHA